MRLITEAVFALLMLAEIDQKASYTLQQVKIECRSKSGVWRSIEVKADEDGCKVYYTRPYENPRIIGAAKHELLVCEQVKKKVVHNLERAGLSCK